MITTVRRCCVKGLQMTRYTPYEIEARWQAAWEKDEIFKSVYAFNQK